MRQCAIDLRVRLYRSSVGTKHQAAVLSDAVAHWVGANTINGKQGEVYFRIKQRKTEVAADGLHTLVAMLSVRLCQRSMIAMLFGKFRKCLILPNDAADQCSGQSAFSIGGVLRRGFICNDRVHTKVNGTQVHLFRQCAQHSLA